MIMFMIHRVAVTSLVVLYKKDPEPIAWIVICEDSTLCLLNCQPNIINNQTAYE